MENPSYYAVIPANVRYSKITPNAKLLYGEITALANKKGYCYASNSYFAGLYHVSEVSVSKWIKELVDEQFITRELIYKDGSKEILNRYLRIVNHPIKEKLSTSPRKVNHPPQEMFKDNNTSINNTYNNTVNITFIDFWDLYDKKVGSRDACEKKWLKLTDAEREQIMVYLPKYKISQPDKKYRKNPDTFFNQKGWEHEIIGYKEPINKLVTIPKEGTIKNNSYNG